LLDSLLQEMRAKACLLLALCCLAEARRFQMPGRRPPGGAGARPGIPQLSRRQGGSIRPGAGDKLYQAFNSPSQVQLTPQERRPEASAQRLLRPMEQRQQRPGQQQRPRSQKRPQQQQRPFRPVSERGPERQFRPVSERAPERQFRPEANEVIPERQFRPVSEKAPKRPFEEPEETPYREEVQRVEAPQEQQRVERRPVEAQQEVQRIQRRPAPQEVQRRPAPQEVQRRPAPQEVQRRPAPQEVQRRPAPQEVQRPKRRPVEAPQYPQDSSTAPQNVVPVFDNSIERASLSAHGEFGGPAEQRDIEAAVHAQAAGGVGVGYTNPQRLSFQIHGQDGPNSYRYGYDTGVGYNRQFKYEERDNYGVLHGRYGYYDQAGKLQVVNYSADPEGGFHAEGEHVPKPGY